MMNFSKIKKGFAALIVLASSLQAIAQQAVTNSGNMQMHPNTQMTFFGDLINNGTFNNNLGSAYFSGDSLQFISGTNYIQFFDVTVNNPSNIKLDQEMQVSGTLIFTLGKIISDKADIATEYVNFLDNATHSGSNANRFIDGVVRKTGDDIFIFPLGEDSVWARLEISAPSLTTDAFTATYYKSSFSNTTTMAVAPTPVLNNVSDIEYWICDRSNGTSNVIVKLYWEDANRSKIDAYTSDLVVARWNGSAWENAGQSAITTNSSGNISSLTVNSFSPFTFGSLSFINNPLPMELIKFEAHVINNNQVKLNWETASEINNDYFTVERFKNTSTWEEVAKIDGAGNSSSLLTYNTIDLNPHKGVSNYRLKQVDFNGKATYSSMRYVYINDLDRMSVEIYPNPAQEKITVEGPSSEIESIKVYNPIGQDISSLIKTTKINDTNIVINLANLPQGVYTIKTKFSAHKVLKE